MAIAEATPADLGTGTPGAPPDEESSTGTPGTEGTATATAVAAGTPTGIGDGTTGTPPGERVGAADTATAMAIAEGTPADVGTGTPDAPPDEDTGIETPGAAGTATAMDIAESTPTDVADTSTAVTDGEIRGTPGTAPATIDATPTDSALTTPTTKLASELPVTGGNPGLGKGWLALGLVVLLVAAGVAALHKGASEQGLR
jgi:hypothetical protein